MIPIPSENDLRSILSEGLTIYQISRQFNTTIKEVHKLKIEYGITKKQKIPKPTKQDLESMYNDEGMTQYQISREFNVDPGTVSRWFSDYKIQTRGSNGTLAVQMPPKEVLEQMYSKDGMTQYQISREFNVTIKTVSNWLHNYKIPTRGNGTLRVPMPPKEVLERMYIDEGMTQYQIGKEFGVTDNTVGVWLYIYNISTVGHMGVPINGSRVPMPPKEVLERMYTDEGMTQYQISREFNVDPGTVSRWFSNYNIQVIVPIPPKEVLEKMYIDEGMSQKQIASKFIVSQCAVYNWFQKYNIPTRGPNGTLNVPMPPKDDLISCIDNGLNQHQIAEKYDVSDWKIFDWCEQLGIPGMVNGYRFTTPEHRNWRDAVLERDNYICQECGSQYKLQSHHIKRYCDYPELEFDVDNGITLCKECHNNIRGREYQYIVKYEDIVLRDRGISDYIVQPRTIIESLPGEPQLEFNSIIDYPQEVIKL